MPPPGLLQRLARSRLNVPRAGTAGGVGEHKSRTLGPGLEFAEHRPYEPGDDLRRVDPFLEARTGELHVREGDVLEQLAVTLLVDMSGSMGYGAAEKSLLARQVAAAFAYVALAGNDRVNVVALTASGPQWGPRAGSARGVGPLFTWLGALTAHGAFDLTHAVRAVAPRLPKPGLCLLISDWLFDAPHAALGLLRAARQEVIGVQILAQEELDPSSMGVGAVTLADAETGAELNLTLSEAALSTYARNLEEWREAVRSALVSQGGIFLEAVSSDEVGDLFLRRWAPAGLVR